ncbi:MAG: poly-gamma-glutamate biosynthesis protein PgsC [Candidatus Marinimicrobia bacterium]|nr:poly-gamma-glutamate biosynthesis protein PgsC [Candidatus Neomarinimicrobiota bacterium]
MNFTLHIDSFVLPYAQYVYLAIGIGMLVGLIFSETMGVMGGGLIVPGYFALHLQDFYSVLITFSIGIFSFLIVRLLSRYIIIFGRRRVILSLLIAFLIGLFFRDYFYLEYIGFIIPGLIASWMDKQGIIRTVSVVLIESSIVHFFLMLIYIYSI